MTKDNQAITIAYGDGIGPELMESAIKILQASGAKLHFNVIEVGEEIYKKGFNSGLMPSAWEELKNTKVMLKAPITTPQGGGYKSLNVTLRKKLGLYANVRPVTSLYPYINSKHHNMDVAIIRENEEDLYMGVEHKQTANSQQCLKLITNTGSEKIIRYAFEYAVKNNRKKVTCFSKDNIMKITDGAFHRIFDEVATQYPDIESEHYIIDIGSARLAAKPEIFDVIVTANLYGDIISDIAAEIAGSVGIAGSANIGDEYAMFEAIHGSAPSRAGQDMANPTGFIQAAIMMLVHIGQIDSANKIRNALFKTIEDGIHTYDIYNEKTSSKKVGTAEFTDAIISRLGSKPTKLPISNFKEISENSTKKTNIYKEEVAKDKKLIGFDLFIDWQDEFEDLISLINSIESEKLEIKIITAKGLIMWPVIDKYDQNIYPKGQTILRFIGKGIAGKSSNQIIDINKNIEHNDIIKMLKIFSDKEVDFIKYEGLYTFGGKAGYSLAQGE
ncbi:NADP-dependent isocitrate dehydrogenase [Rickettsiales bacterium]|nr:NADP-dependent isocitrate dehydrogenase [Rickettsiales bacterium]MDB2550242.1 NADP-dependent isocitrate dehydrogenase [Rickettsiales bacterium]